MKKYKVVILEENQLKPNHLKPIQTFNVAADNIRELFSKCYHLTNFSEVIPLQSIPSIPQVEITFKATSNTTLPLIPPKHSPVSEVDKVTTEIKQK